jgi:hypothetical protein
VQREHIPPSACVPSNRPEVVLTVMDCDHTWMMRMERTTINIMMMGRAMKKEEAGTRWGPWGSFITSERPSLR